MTRTAHQMFSDARNRYYRDRETAARVLASEVGKAMAKSGLPKATAYKSFGRDVDGYEVKATSSGGVIVYSTLNGRPGLAESFVIREHLTAHGYDVTEPTMVNSYVGAMKVTRRPIDADHGPVANTER